MARILRLASKSTSFLRRLLWSMCELWLWDGFNSSFFSPFHFLSAKTFFRYFYFVQWQWQWWHSEEKKSSEKTSHSWIYQHNPYLDYTHSSTKHIIHLTNAPITGAIYLIFPRPFSLEIVSRRCLDQQGKHNKKPLVLSETLI